MADGGHSSRSQQLWGTAFDCPSVPGGPPQKGDKKINKENKIFFFQIFIGDVFPKKLGLDSILESWDLTIRIPHRKLRIWSYSQVETRQYRSKYSSQQFRLGILTKTSRPKGCFFVFFAGLPDIFSKSENSVFLVAGRPANKRKQISRTLNKNLNSR